MKKACCIIILTIVCSVLFSLPGLVYGYPIGKHRELNGNTYKIGDMNSDGFINAEDALIILKYAARLMPLDEVNCFIGNTRSDWETLQKVFEMEEIMNPGNGNKYFVTSQDALTVLQYAAKALPDESIWYSDKNMLVSSVDSTAVDENKMWEIADYETYISSMDELVEIYGADVSIRDSFTEEFFTEEKLVAALVCGLQEDAKISFNRLVYNYKLNGTVLKLDAYVPAPPIENQGAWFVLLPVEQDTKIEGELSVDVEVEQETWVYDEAVKIDKEKVDVFIGTDLFYNNADELSAREPLINVISNYSEYEEYVASVDPDGDYSIEEYSADYFNENVIVVVGYYASDYSTDVSFYDIRQSVSDGRYQINLELKHSMISLPMCRPWIIMIPFEGKDHTAEDFFVEYIGVFNNLPWQYKCSNAVPVDVDYGDKGFKILSTYEEYCEYMELFLAANPDKGLSRQYSEEEFEYLDVVVGGFWTFSGQLELEYDETIIREGKMTIYFNGRCPETFTEDSYYFHYIFVYERMPEDKDNIEIVTDVEYY